MKKLLALLLCAALLCPASLAFAERAPWLAPFFTFVDGAKCGEGITRAELRLSLEPSTAEDAEIVFSSDTDPEVAEAFGSLILRTNAISRETLRAYGALLNACVLKITCSSKLLRAELLVDDQSVADIEMWVKPNGQDYQITVLTSFLPSFAFTASIKATDLQEIKDTTLQRAYEKLLALSKEGDGLTLLSDGLKEERAEAEYFLGGGASKTLTAEEYRKLLNDQPNFCAGALAVLEELLSSYSDDLSNQDVPDGAIYHIERIGENAYASALSSVETNVDYPEKEDGQGYNRTETHRAVTRMITVGETTSAFTEYGHADETKNKRMLIDLSKKDEPRIALETSLFSGAATFNRSEDAQRVALDFSDGQAAIQGEAAADNDGKTLTAGLSWTQENQGRADFDLTAQRDADEAEGDAPDLAGRTILTPAVEGLQSIVFSETDEKLIKDELYNVTRPKLIQFAFVGLPKGAEALSPMLMMLAAQLGR